jgi:nitrogen regulatory protein PII
MKMITAIIRNSKIDALNVALNEIGVHGMTTTYVNGYGKQKGATEVYRGAEMEIKFNPKIRVDIAVTDDKTDQTVGVIVDTEKTGNVGDGKIFITEISKVVRVRTGETNEQVL